MRKKFVAGNWKMHKTSKEALSYIKEFKQLVNDVKDCDIVLCVPFTLLSLIKNECKGTNIKLGAQNVFYESQGAYTGEVSPFMVKDYADYVLIGHSERRKYFNETNEVINKKIKAALKNNLKVIFCLGETLDQRKSNQTNSVIETQLRDSLEGIKDLNNIVIAYEPVWAIGTGNTATPDQTEEVHAFLRKLVEKVFDKKTADTVRIIYGGSVNPDNASSILEMPNIDGCLPGGASLDSKKLEKIIKS